MFFQLATEETLVPPNFNTTQGDVLGEVLAAVVAEGAVVISKPHQSFSQLA
jgi:hypothetical protein